MIPDFLRRDIRELPLYQEAKQLLGKLRGAGGGQLSDAGELDVSTDGRYALFSGTVVQQLEGVPPTRIWLLNLDTGEARAITPGPNTDRSAKFSPDAQRVAFLSDRARAGDFQLHLLTVQSGETVAAPSLPGWVEYLHWSPDGKRILLGLAGHGADTAGSQGGITSAGRDKMAVDWLPSVEMGDESNLWRSVWVYDLDANAVRQVNRPGTNIWEAVWCGNDALAAVVSSAPDEGVWYTATLICIEIRDGSERTLYSPKDQLGHLSASPSGNHVVAVEAVCSDRAIVAGDALLISTEDGAVERLDTRGVDIGTTQWRSDRRLLMTGHRGFESVACLYDLDAHSATEVWASDELTSGGRGRYFTGTGIGASGDFALISEGFLSAPEIAVVRGGRYRAVLALDAGYREYIARHAQFEKLVWKAPDGLEIHGYLMTPRKSAPHAVVMEIHGGPVNHWRPRWLAREGLHSLLLLQHGFAVFWPNPRGSSGRGQDFARRVQGDLCGADTHDYLSGLDALVVKGVVDPKRIGVMGRSYGGCMTAWLVTQDTRFAAAMALAPHVNQVSQHLTSNIPKFDSLFLADRYDRAEGKYFERSAVMHARKARTPTLNMCGALDRCTPPTQAREFHNALREHGCESVLVTYPLEGHGNKQFPAVIDYAARVTGWFDLHMLSVRP